MSAQESMSRLVQTWVASGRPEDIDTTVSGIADGKLTLLEVVKALGEYLTSEEDTLRIKGVQFLSEILAKCPPERVNRQAVRVLVTFYCSKLDDAETIRPALSGLKSLAQMPTFTSIDATETMKAISEHVKMRAHVQIVRHTVLSTVDLLLDRHRDALKAMGSSFLSAYIELAENEKDPRNLLVAFAIARVILIEFDISGHVEGFYDIIFCYFPISYRPPPDDPYGIAPEDLRIALRQCICATPLFGSMGISMFLEKLMSGSPATKRDTLKTMTASLPIYGSALATSRAQKLWSSLKLEIFQPSDPETEQDALTATQSLVQTIYADTDKDSGGIMGFAEEVCQECLEILQQPEKSQARPAIKVICALVLTTSPIAKYVTFKIIPHLTALFLNPDEIGNREPILALLAATLAAIRSAPKETEAPPPLLGPYKDDTIGVLTVGLKTAATRKPALDGLESLVLMENLLTDEELGFVVHNINEAMDSDDAGTNIDSLLGLLSTISSISSHHLEETTLPRLFSSLPDQAPALSAPSEREKYWKTLASLKKICVQQALFETLVIRLSTKLDLICSSATESTEHLEVSVAYAHAILKALSDVLALKVAEGHADVPKYAERLLPSLFNLFLHAALVSGEKQALVACDIRLIRSLATIITLVVQTLPQSGQSLFATKLAAAYVDGTVKTLASGHQSMPDAVLFQPFQSIASIAQKNTVALFAAGVVALRAETLVSPLFTSKFVANILTWSLQVAENDLQREAAHHIVASILNKKAPDMASYLISGPEVFWSENVAFPSSSLAQRRNTIQAWIWISKALLLRNHELLPQFTDKLFGSFNDNELSIDAAKAIGSIGSGGGDVLTKLHHNVIKILHQQRFVSRILPSLIEGAQVTERSRRQESCLIALTSLIKSVPYSTYSHEMSRLMPLLLRGLELQDPAMRTSVLETLLAAASTEMSVKQNIVSEHATSLVRTLLKNVLFGDMPSAHVRIAALRYLAALPSIVRYDVLHPVKPDVLRTLGKAVDDPKRSVRKEAVDTRTIWYAFGG